MSSSCHDFCRDAHEPYVAVVTGPDFEVGLTDTELATFISSLLRLQEAVSNLSQAGQWGPQSGDRPESRVRQFSPPHLGTIHCA